MQTIKNFVENTLPEFILLSLALVGYIGTSWYTALNYLSPAQQTLYASGIVAWTVVTVVAMYFATAYRNR